MKQTKISIEHLALCLPLPRTNLFSSDEMNPKVRAIRCPRSKSKKRSCNLGRAGGKEARVRLTLLVEDAAVGLPSLFAWPVPPPAYLITTIIVIVGPLCIEIEKYIIF